MPLYTYVASYRGAIHAEQGRFSNYTGFAPGLLGKLPDGALPGLTPALRNDLVREAYICQWSAVSNRTHLWRTSFDVGGHEMVVYAIETKP